MTEPAERGDRELYLRQIRVAAELATFGVAGVLLVSAALPTTAEPSRSGILTTAFVFLGLAVALRLVPARFALERYLGGGVAAQLLLAYLLLTTGGPASPFLVYYPLPLFGSSLALNLRGALAAGFVAVLGFAVVTVVSSEGGAIAELRDRGIAGSLALVGAAGATVLVTWTMERAVRALGQRSAELAEQNRALETARTITLALSRLRERDDIIRAIYDAARRAIGAERVWVFFDEAEQYRKGWTTDASGRIEPYVTDAGLRDPPRLRAVHQQRTIVVEDSEKDAGVTARARQQYGLRAAIFMPLLHRGQIVGIAAFSCSTPRRWTAPEIRLAETIAEGSAAAIATYLAFEELRVERQQLAQRTRVLEGLASLADALAISPNDDAAARAAARAIQQSFGLRAATVLFTDPSLALLEPRASAGEATAHPVVQNPHTCPAIKSGHHFRVESETTPVQCPYVPFQAGTNGLLCAPLVAAGQTVGAVFLEPTDASVLDEPLVRAAADRVGLHVANQRVLETAQRQAVTDGLTGLYNRHFMSEQLRLFHSLAERHGRTYSVIAFDIDGLKRVNDTFGHEAGDLALRGFANALKRNLRTEDVPVRTGGDEFVVILPDTPLQGAVLVAERVRVTLEQNGLAQPNAAITASAGVASWQAGKSAQEIVKAADAALYAAKGAGKGRVASEAEPAQAS